MLSILCASLPCIFGSRSRMKFKLITTEALALENPCKELCAVFPDLQSLVIGLMNGLYDASGGVFLLFKFVYDAPVNISLKDMLIFYAACSSMIWIKTFCLSALTFARENMDGNYSIFEDSFLGRLLYKNNEINEEKVKENDKKVEGPKVTNSKLFAN